MANLEHLRRQTTGVRCLIVYSAEIFARLPHLRIFAECNYLLTTDDRLLKYSSDRIKIIDPIEFIKRIGGTDDE